MSVTICEIYDLVEREGLYYKKFTEVPFTGKVDGKGQGSFKDGEKDGSWVRYWDNVQLMTKGDYKNGKKEGSWVNYNQDGTVNKNYAGTFKDGKRIND